eukprot:3301812-Pleurochrysis_carterae.AAC.1
MGHGERGAGGRCEDGVEVSGADPPQYALRHRRERQVVIAPAQGQVYGLHLGAPRVQLRCQGGWGRAVAGEDDQYSPRRVARRP